MFTKYYHDYKIGDVWRSNGRTITETDIVNFASFSGDWFPLHTDKAYAANTAFGQRIAHGMLVLSVSTGLLDFGPGIVVAFYGMEKVRFTNPTYIGDTIHVEMTVTALEEKQNGTGIVTAKQEIKKQTGETVVAAIFKILVNKE